MHCKTLLLQVDSEGHTAQEGRVLLGQAMLRDIPVLRVHTKTLALHASDLLEGNALPVGNIAFLREAMRLAGIAEPDNLSYPDVLRPYLHRNLERRAAGSISGKWFIKPVETKAFTGCVFDPFENPEGLSAHDRLQYNAFLALTAQQLVWVSEPVSWISEARYYVMKGDILGVGQYGEYPDEAPLPAIEVVRDMIKAFAGQGAPSAYVLDVGVLADGKTALVECNDAWAIGYYKGTLNGANYLALLQRRWQELCDRRYSTG